MPHRLRKIRRQRGSRTHGWGQVGQHRSGGSRGGKGKTGGHKHKWTHTIKYAPNRYGKKGFASRKKMIPTTINIGQLNEIIEKLLDNNQATKSPQGITIDLSLLGIDKLLGKGRVDTPVIIKVESYSQLALKKIKETGGQILEIKS
jgi:large subunit ribosomal protein L15